MAEEGRGRKGAGEGLVVDLDLDAMRARMMVRASILRWRRAWLVRHWRSWLSWLSWKGLFFAGAVVEVVLEGEAEAECERGFWIGTACDEMGGCHCRRSRLFTVGAYPHVG